MSIGQQLKAIKELTAQKAAEEKQLAQQRRSSGFSDLSNDVEQVKMKHKGYQYENKRAQQQQNEQRAAPAIQENLVQKQPPKQTQKMPPPAAANLYQTKIMPQQEPLVVYEKTYQDVTTGVKDEEIRGRISYNKGRKQMVEADEDVFGEEAKNETTTFIDSVQN